MPKTAVEGPAITMMKPEFLLADDNSRYGLKKTRIETLAADIQEKGEVMVPLEAEPLAEPVGRATHRITHGHYRHAAVMKLNQDGAGLLVPVIVVETGGDPLVRLMRQLSENLQRESSSPMDKAIAMLKMKELGATQQAVRTAFALPGGPKGNVVQMASNSYVNMHLSFLELPKSMQEKIHDGRIGVQAAYQLTRVSPDKRQAVLESAEAERLKAFAQEEKDEAKLSKAEHDAAEIRTKDEALTVELETAKVTAEKAKADAEAKRVAAQALYGKAKEAPKEAKEDAQAAFKAAEADFDLADKAKKDAEKAAAKIEDAKKKLAEKAVEHAARLKEARAKKSGGKDKTVVGGEDVKKAAAKVDGSIPVLLNAANMREVINDMSAESGFPIVTGIFKLVQKVFQGAMEPSKLLTACAKVTGEKKAAKAA